MSVGTKVTVAIVVLFVAVLGIYYGFGGPKGAPAGSSEIMPPAEDEPAAETTPGEETAGPDAGGPADWSTQDLFLFDGTANNAGPVLARDEWGGLNANELEFGGGEVTVQPVLQSNDPWVLRAPTLMPEPETAVTQRQTPGGPVQTVEYLVQENDSMWTIADQWFGDPTRWKEIARANPNINPDRLRVGQRLRLPAQKTAGPVGLNRAIDLTEVRSAPAPGAARQTYHTVRSGDSLSTIAQKHYQSGSKWRAIYDANRSAIGWDPNRLTVGMRLVIPESRVARSTER